MRGIAVLFAVLCGVGVSVGVGAASASAAVDFIPVIDDFAAKLLQSLHGSSHGRNVFVSPLSIQMTFALYSTGVTPKVREQMMRTMFGGQNEQAVWQYFKSLRHDVSANDALLLANKMYFNGRYGHRACPAFEGHAHGFGAELEMMTFDGLSAAAINQWVSAKSNGKISKMFEDNDLSYSTMSVILDIIHFKASWEKPFNKTFSKEGDFQLNKNQNVTKEFLNSRFPTEMKYVKDDVSKAQAVELKYKEAGFRMIVVVPDEVDGLPRVLNQIAGAGLGPLLKTMKSEKVVVKMPKFEFTFGIDLRQELSKIGVKYLFEQSASGIVCNEALSISKAFQKTAISVDEKGAEAAAVSGVVGPVDSPGNTKFVTANRPFLFAILKDALTVFVGTYDR